MDGKSLLSNLTLLSRGCEQPQLSFPGVTSRDLFTCLQPEADEWVVLRFPLAPSFFGYLILNTHVLITYVLSEQ